MDMKVSSTIAYERAHNALLAVDDEAEFVEATTSSLGPQPPNFQAIVAINRGPLLIDRVGVEPLTPLQVQHKIDEGALVVDVRTDRQFDDAHIPGAVCNPAVRAGFGTKLAGSPTATATSCWSVGTTRTPCVRRSSPPRSGSATSPATWPAA
jgi:hydroxyacylglutathione hydrolase